MTRQTIDTKVREIIISIRNLDIASSELGQDLSEIDSLNLVELISQIEEEFDIELEDEEIEFYKIQNIDSIVNLIVNKTA